MPIRRIPFGEWLPDLGEFNNQGLYKVKGAVNASGRWLPNPVFGGTDLTGNGAVTYNWTEAYGAHVHSVTTDPTSFRIFVATRDDILRGTTDNGLGTQRATAAGVGTPDTISGTQFTSFGNAVYAAMYSSTSGSSYFLRAATPSTNFATFIAATSPTTYNPNPRYVSTIKNHLLIGHVEMQSTLGEFTSGTVYPNLVMWSATDDPSRWGDELVANYPETVGSSYQHLYDEFGPITGLCGGADYAYIFKPRAIYRMDGPEWSFHPVVTGAGTIYPNSIVRFYNDVYFWGPGGPARLRYGSSEVENLALGKCQRAVTEFQNYEFFDYVFELDDAPSTFPIPYSGETAPINISAAADYRAGLIVFAFADNAQEVVPGSDWVRSSGVLVFDTGTEAFSFFSVPTRLGFIRSVPRYGKNPPPTNSSQHSVVDGFFGVGLDRDVQSSGDISAVASIGDIDPLSSITISGAGDYLYDWFPKLTTAYNPLFIDDNNGPVTTSVSRVRVPFSVKRFAESIVDGYSSETEEWTVKVNVTVRSKNRHAGEAEEVTGSWWSASTSQQPDGWIDLNGGKGSTEAEYHQFEIQIVTLNLDGTEVNSAIVHLRDLTYFEVEYNVGNPTGSTYIA